MSFNNALLQYQDKRIAFGEDSYNRRMNLAILDWNEHVDRPATSVQPFEDVTAPRKKQPKARLTKKQY